MMIHDISKTEIRVDDAPHRRSTSYLLSFSVSTAIHQSPSGVCSRRCDALDCRSTKLMSSNLISHREDSVQFPTMANVFGETSSESFDTSELELGSLPTVMCPVVGWKELVTALVTKVSCASWALHVETTSDPLYPIGTVGADLTIL